jgi:hypothetical protein
MMAALRDLPGSTDFQKLPVDDQKRIAAALRGLATKLGSMKPRSAFIRGRGEAALATGHGREHRQEVVRDVSQKASFGKLVEQVNFPAFVGGLINGVFNATVDGSIQQMDAYGKLLSEVAESIEERCKTC